MAREETQKTLDSFGPPNDFVITNEDCREIIAKFDKRFGGFNPRGINKFYEEAGIARVEWEIKKTDGTTEPVPDGRNLTALVYSGMKEQKGFKNYQYFSDTPLEFWDHIFGQVSKYLAKVDYAKKKELEELAKTQPDVTRNNELPVLPTGDSDKERDGEELSIISGILVPDKE